MIEPLTDSVSGEWHRPKAQPHCRRGQSAERRPRLPSHHLSIRRNAAGQDPVRFAASRSWGAPALECASSAREPSGTSSGGGRLSALPPSTMARGLQPPDASRGRGRFMPFTFMASEQVQKEHGTTQGYSLPVGTRSIRVPDPFHERCAQANAQQTHRPTRWRVWSGRAMRSPRFYS